MNIDGVEGCLRPSCAVLHEMQAHHHHPRHPEEDDVEARDEHIRGIVALELWRLFGPAKRREWPECRGKPRIEYVFIAAERHGLAIVSEGRRLRQLLALFDENLAIRPIPSRYLMTPPKLTRDAPRLDVAHPFKIGLFPLGGYEDRFASLHCLGGRLSKSRGVDTLLHGEPWLNDVARPVSMPRLMDMGLDPCAQALVFHHRDDAFSRLKTVEAMQRQRFGRNLGTLEKIRIPRQCKLCKLIEDVDAA